jgi:hypothetical protein
VKSDWKTQVLRGKIAPAQAKTRDRMGSNSEKQFYSWQFFTGLATEHGDGNNETRARL